MIYSHLDGQWIELCRDTCITQITIPIRHTGHIHSTQTACRRAGKESALPNLVPITSTTFPKRHSTSILYLQGISTQQIHYGLMIMYSVMYSLVFYYLLSDCPQRQTDQNQVNRANLPAPEPSQQYDTWKRNQVVPANPYLSTTEIPSWLKIYSKAPQR